MREKNDRMHVKTNESLLFNKLLWIQFFTQRHYLVALRQISQWCCNSSANEKIAQIQNVNFMFWFFL